MIRSRPAVMALGLCAMLLAGCSHPIEGKAVSVFADPFSVAGMPTADGPSGLRDNAEPPTVDVQGGDGGEDDTVAASAVSDVEDFWRQAYPAAFGGDFTPVKATVSWDAKVGGSAFCDNDTYHFVNAVFCDEQDTIGWDRGVLIPSLRKRFGDMAVGMVLAHEYGHAIQLLAKLNSRHTPTLVSEQQADCFSGVYLRWVAEGNSKRFTLSTAGGLTSTLAAMISIRDPILSSDEPNTNEHGSAFERITALQFGFTDGATACAAIDVKDIAQRRGDLPVALQADSSGELPVSEQSVRNVLEALTTLFSPEHPPQLSLDPSQASSCSDGRPSPPASYCPSTNTIAVDLPGLVAMGVKSDGDGGSALLSGDNSAYSALTSRFMLAIEHEHGDLVLDNAEAALRTACLTGVATAKMSTKVTVADGTSIQLTAGDLDEAVAGLLDNGLVASNVNGDTVPSGFARMDAFRAGVLGTEDRCINRFR